MTITLISVKIEIAQDKNKWNNFLLQNPRDGLFLQSWEWGETLIKTGQRVERLQVVENGEVVAQAQVVYKKLPFGWQYALAGKGPVFAKRGSHNADPRVWQILFEYLKNEKCIFFRSEPVKTFSDMRYTFREVKDINPPATLVLDITKSEQELLAAMHEKTRYNIRLAERKGLRVTEEKNFAIFWDLLQKTGERDDFALHAQESYEAVMSSENVRQIIVWSGEVPVASAALIGFGNTMYYLYGASDHSYRQLMGPHLMQWEAIKLAKKLGYTKYDFFGIAPRMQEGKLASPPFQGGVRPARNASRSEAGGGGLPSSVTSAPQSTATPPGLPLERGGGEYEYDTNHRYAGVTRFKLGFGGEAHEEPGTFDLIVSSGKYRIYQLLKQIRQLSFRAK